MEPPTDQQDLLPLPTAEEQAEAPAEEQPTKSVENFWERLDKVFAQNNELKERMDELVSQFPEFERSEKPVKSFLYQPERICISSNDDPSTGYITSISEVSEDEAGNLNPTGGHQVGEMFSQFRIKFQRPLLEVKSIQLLSAVIPNAIQNIPDNSTVFYYYRIPSLTLSSTGEYNPATTYNKGDIVYYTPSLSFFCCSVNETTGIPPSNPSNWLYAGPNGARPNYFAITADNLNAVFTNPTNGLPADFTAAVINNTYNRTYTDYDDLVSALNLCAQLPGQIAGPAPVSTLEFAYNAQLNKIQMIPDPAQIAAGYFFFPAGYDDPNIPIFMEPGVGAGGIFEEIAVNFTRGYTMNLRLGFTWNGLYQDPFINNPYILGITDSVKNTLYWYLRPTDIFFGPAATFQQNRITANNYGDLVNTSCVRIYCDFIFGSTQDSNNQQGLLSIVPVNATNLGVAFYQNNFNNALTKIPKILQEISIRLVTDQGFPYQLPNSAVVLLELAVEYK